MFSIRVSEWCSTLFKMFHVLMKLKEIQLCFLQKEESTFCCWFAFSSFHGVSFTMLDNCWCQSARVKRQSVGQRRKEDGGSCFVLGCLVHIYTLGRWDALCSRCSGLTGSTLWGLPTTTRPVSWEQRSPQRTSLPAWKPLCLDILIFTSILRRRNQESGNIY